MNKERMEQFNKEIKKKWINFIFENKEIKKMKFINSI